MDAWIALREAIKGLERERWETVGAVVKLQDERDALRAEVEAMRELLANNWPCRCGHPLCKRCRHDAEVSDALRANKDKP